MNNQEAMTFAFDTQNDSVQEAEVAEATHTPTKTCGEVMAQAWRAYVDAVDTYIGSLTNVNEQVERRIHSLSPLDIPSDYDIRGWKESAAEHMVDAMIRHAQQHFALPGLPLKINAKAVHERFPVRTGDNIINQFDHREVWRYLEQEYGGGQGTAIALQQAANKIVAGFRLNRTEEVKRRSGGVVLNISVFIDSLDKKFTNKSRLSVHCLDKVGEIFHGLACFSEYVGRRKLAADLDAQKKRWGWGTGPDREITTRARYGLGDGGSEIVMTTYTSSFELLIRADVAEELQLFVSKYGEMKREEAA